jgi:hypothetical protein
MGVLSGAEGRDAPGCNLQEIGRTSSAANAKASAPSYRPAVPSAPSA